MRATDPAGNVDPTEAARTWSVDTVAPDTTLTGGPTGPTAAKTASFSLGSADPEAGFQCKLDDGAWQTCTSPRVLDDLSEGPHSFRVRAVDPAGNVDATEAVRTWTVDTQAPDTTISAGPSGHVATGSASFAFSSSESGSSFECKLDDGAWQACTSPRALTGLADGDHTLRVRALDTAGNADPTEATRSWTVDTQAPDTTISTGPAGPTASTSAEPRLQLQRDRVELRVQARRRRLAGLHLAARPHRARAGSPHLPRTRHRRGREHRRHRGRALVDRGHRGT